LALSGRPRAANFSKLFHGNSKLFQRNSKEIPNFSKDFQTFSLAVSWEIKELSARRAGNWISWTFSFGWSQIYSGATNPLQLLTLHGRS
jgi:hypothetical protein